mgnify:FL=1
MTSPADVLQMVKDNDVKFVDYRLTDTRGKEQHMTVPAHQLTEDTSKTGRPLTARRWPAGKALKRAT